MNSNNKDKKVKVSLLVDGPQIKNDLGPLFFEELDKSSYERVDHLGVTLFSSLDFKAHTLQSFAQALESVRADCLLVYLQHFSIEERNDRQHLYLDISSIIPHVESVSIPIKMIQTKVERVASEILETKTSRRKYGARVKLASFSTTTDSNEFKNFLLKFGTKIFGPYAIEKFSLLVSMKEQNRFDIMKEYDLDDPNDEEYWELYVKAKEASEGISDDEK